MAANIIHKLSQQLLQTFSKEEVHSFVRILLEDLGEIPAYRQQMLADSDISPALEELLKQAAERLMHDEPIQYITGKAFFYGLPLQVTSDVLIPRPETEELVDLILKEHPEVGLRVIDFGTGSGCIAIALSKHLESSEVAGVDVSKKALTVAAGNSQLNQTPVRWVHADVLSEDIFTLFEEGSVDIIVSNPPYVLDKEKQAMNENVLSFEPHLALFVPDNDPLRFYRRIAIVGQHLLRSGGMLYFEINEAFGLETVEMLEAMNYKSVVLLQDMFGKDRMIKAIK